MNKMPDFIDYIRACLKMAVKHRVGWADSIALIVGLALPLAPYFRPQWFPWAPTPVMIDLYREIPLCGVGAFVLMRLGLSPYWLCQKHRNTAAILRAQLSQYTEARQLAEEAADDKKVVDTMLGGYLQLMEAAFHRLKQTEPVQFDDATTRREAAEWTRLRGVVVDFLEKHISEAAAEFFKSTDGAIIEIGDIPSKISDPAERKQFFLDSLTEHHRNLKEIIKKRM